MRSKLAKVFTPRNRRVIYRLLIIAVSAILLTYFLEWRFFGNNNTRTWQFIIERGLVFWYNVLLMFFIECIITSFFKHIFTGVGITLIIEIIITYINANKQAFRGQPLLPEDFMLADQTGTLTKFIDFSSLIRTIVAVLLVIALIVILNFSLSKLLEIPQKPEPKRFWNKRNRVLRFVLATIGVVGFFNATDFARNHSGERTESLPFLNSAFVAWNQNTNYEYNGFILGFMYNWSKFDMEMPDGYSEEKVAEIKASVNTDEIISENEKKKELEDFNVVVILDESFFDVSVISDYYPYTAKNVGSKNKMGIPITEDVTPNIHKLIKNDKKNSKVATGQMYTIDYGGGTANIEFEVDTSMTNYWANTVPFVDLIPHVDSVQSIASIAKDNGFNTYVIHPFNSGMYKRNISLPKLGYDNLIFEDDFEFREHDDNRQYINDRSSYKEALKAIKNSKEPAMISLITMQNHAGYGDDYESYNYKVADAPRAGDNRSKFTSDEKSQVETYLETLHNSDYYLGEFISELEKSDEKTVVLFYGDHSPGIFARVNDSKSKEVRDLSRVTPYFVWSNFTEIDANKADTKNVKRFNISGTTLPTTTPNCLMNTMFETLDLKKPDYMQITNKVCEEVPILAQAYYGSSAPFKSSILSSYEIYTYDILGGKRYWLN